MPVQMVCDSTSLVSAALRDTLTSSSTTSSSSVLSASNSVSVVSSATGDSGPLPSLFVSTSEPSSSNFLVPENDDFDRLESGLSVNISRNQLRPIQYEEVPSFSNEVDTVRSKYTVLKTTASSNGISYPGSIGSSGASNGSTNTSTLLMNGVSNSTMTTKSGAVADSVSNGIGSGSGGNSNQHSGSSHGSGKDKLPTPKRILYARENVQIGWKANGRRWNVGAGMINVGNTCYLNSTLQALFHVPAIANWLLSDIEHRDRCDENTGQGNCIICAMANTLLDSQKNQGAIKPVLVYSKLRIVCKHLVPGRQEDAHEFLRYLVEAMEKSYLSRFKNSKDLDQYSKETTPLNQILGGYLRSEVKCLSCQHISTTFQHFEDLLLDIRKANSIEEALSVYFAKERLEEMQYKCEACKKRVAATKQFYLERAPFALCIQLKRFSMLGGKINKHVELRGRLDLTPYTKSASSNGKLIYKLVSMVTHLGNTQHCGHYTAIGGTENGNYYVFDDSSVRPIAMQNVTNTNAYIIFYELENVPNGVKTSAASTATLASFASSTAPHYSKMGNSNSGSIANHSGTSANSSPLRAFGSSNNSNHNPLAPSKLEKHPEFIGPLLPQNTPEKAKKLVNGLSNNQVDDLGEPVITSTSSRLSPVSSTTSSLSSPSPVKPSGASSPSKLVRNPVSINVSSLKKFNANGGITNGIIGNCSNNSYKNSSISSSLCSSVLPSMPKLCNSTSATKNTADEKFTNNAGDGKINNGPTVNTIKSHTFYGYSSSSTSYNGNNNNKNHLNGHSNSKMRSLVPYDPDDDDEDDDEGEADSLKRHNGMHPHDDDESDEDVDRIHSHVLLGPGTNKQLGRTIEEESTCSPKSPPVIKTKAGLWQVSTVSSSSSSGSTNTSKNASPDSSGNSSPANYGVPSGNVRNGPLASGYQANIRQSNMCNNNNNNYSNPNGGNYNNRSNDVVDQLRKYSHQGYGAPMRRWNDQQTYMENELAQERREERKRQFNDDYETEMDRGRIKKVKTNINQRDYNHQSQPNMFQSYQNHMINGIGNGGNTHNNNNNRRWINNNHFGGPGKYGGGFSFQHRHQNGNHPRNHHGFRNGRHGRNGPPNKSHNHYRRDNGGGGRYHNR